MTDEQLKELKESPEAKDAMDHFSAFFKWCFIGVFGGFAGGAMLDRVLSFPEIPWRRTECSVGDEQR